MRSGFAVALALGALACGHELPGAEMTVRAEFAALSAVQCIRVTVVGGTRTVSLDFAATVGRASQSLTVRQVPTGDVLVMGSAFDAPCAGVTTQHPTWVAGAVLQTLDAGVSASLTLVFRPNGEASVTADFKGATGEPADGSCLRVAVVGATRTVERNLELGASVFALSDLPTGDVLFVADAFAAPCSGITSTTERSWHGTPVRATLTAGAPASVTIELQMVIVIAVSISPRVVFTNPGGTVTFTGTVTGGTSGQSTAVTWSVQEAGGGAVDSSGGYTAPVTAGTYHVVATSVADPSKSDAATVSVPTTPLIAPDRMTTWSPGLNAVGGIPGRTTIYRRLSPSGGDDTADIEAALDACPPNQVVKLNAGTFNINGKGLHFRTSDCTLRGSGTGKPGSGAGGTRLIKADRDTNPSFAVLYIGFDPSQFSSSTNLASDAIKGTNSLTLVSNPGIQVGEIVLIDHITDDDPQVIWGPNNDPPGGASRRWFVRQDRSLSQMMEVTAVTGNTITFATPFHITFKTIYTAQLSRYAQPVLQRTGVEDIYFYGGMGGDGHGNVSVNLCAYCWIKNIEAQWSVGTSVGFYGTYRSELRDSYIHETPDPNPGGAGYLTGLNFGASENLIENNIMWYGNKVVVMRGTGGGNVFAYNYTEDAFGSQYPNQPEAGLNAAHYTTPHMELLEGNRSWNYQGDAFWGNSIYITVFRNQLTGLRGAIAPLNTYTFTAGGATYPYMDLEGRAPVRIEGHSLAHNLVGNVLGFPGQTLLTYSGSRYSYTQTSWTYEALTADPDTAVPMWKIGFGSCGPNGCPPWDPLEVNTIQRDGNWDWYTQSQRWHGIGGAVGTGTPTTIPDSLYLARKPAFFGSNPWPWVDPSTGAVYTLPAKARFDSMH